MKSVEEHLADCRTLLAPARTVVVPPLEAVGAVLAADLVAPADSPAAATSAMDGWAVRAGDSPGRLRITGEVRAGIAPTVAVGRGEAVRIMTGSLLPAGADAVVPVEESREHDGAVELSGASGAGRNIRPRGDDVRAGDVVLPAGAVLGPAQVSALVVVARVPVLARRRVCVLSTGDELVAPGTTPGPAQLVDGNGPTVAAAARAAGAEVVHVGRCGDDPAALLDALASLPPADLVVTTGGVSRGSYDVVREALQPQGIRFEQVALQPGRPQAWGRLPDGTAYLGLPGNPVAAYVSFELFGRAALGRERTAVRTVLLEEVAGCARGRRQVLRARLEPGGVRLVGGRGSHLVGALARSDCLLVVPEDDDRLERGALVDVLLLGD